LAVVLVAGQAVTAAAQEKPAGGNSFALADGNLTLTAPAHWQRKEPANRIVEVEFAIPPAKGDQTPGRLTAMGAAGTVQANIDRWIDQFAGPGGAQVKPQRDKATISGCEVETVSLTGTYKDMPGGPFAGGKTILRENYRMLGAIIQTKDRGNYFLKLYGPKATIDENEVGFQQMVKSLKAK
jgi:hypothetical protein